MTDSKEKIESARQLVVRTVEQVAAEYDAGEYVNEGRFAAIAAESLAKLGLYPRFKVGQVVGAAATNDLPKRSVVRNVSSGLVIEKLQGGDWFAVGQTQKKVLNNTYEVIYLPGHEVEYESVEAMFTAVVREAERVTKEREWCPTLLSRLAAAGITRPPLKVGDTFEGRAFNDLPVGTVFVRTLYESTRGVPIIRMKLSATQYASTFQSNTVHTWNDGSTNEYRIVYLPTT